MHKLRVSTGGGGTSVWQCWFQNLFDARQKIAAWRKEYNEERPDSSLGYKTPKEFAATKENEIGNNTEGIVNIFVMKTEGMIDSCSETQIGYRECVRLTMQKKTSQSPRARCRGKPEFAAEVH